MLLTHLPFRCIGQEHEEPVAVSSDSDIILLDSPPRKSKTSKAKTKVFKMCTASLPLQRTLRCLKFFTIHAFYTNIRTFLRFNLFFTKNCDH